jgi:trk system potassium uptake protein TrkA
LTHQHVVFSIVSMHIVILGAGSVGFHIAKQLIDEGKDVVIIEKDQKAVKHAINYLDCSVIHDVGNNVEVLKKANIDKADFFISVTDSDEVNMIACGLVANNTNVPNKIARVRNIDYSRARIMETPFLGIDHIVNPELEASKVIIRSIERGALSDILFFEKSNFQIRNMTVSADSPFRTLSVEDMKRNWGINFLVAFILRDNDYIIPSGETIIKEGDNLYIISTEQNLEKIFASAGKDRFKLNKIVIVGGGKIGSYVADYLLRKQRSNERFFTRVSKALVQRLKRNIVIIDKDPEKCNDLSERFSDALIINEDVSDEGIYEEGQISDYDLILTSTDNQELNLVTAVYAKNIGFKRAIAVVNKYNYLNIASRLGIDVTVSQKNSMVNSILKLIRRGNIKNIYSFADGRVEVIELLVENSPLAGRQISDIKLPPHTLVVSITRDEENILPDGTSSLHNGDHIILIAQKESIPKIEAIFTGKT